MKRHDNSAKPSLVQSLKVLVFLAMKHAIYSKIDDFLFISYNYVNVIKLNYIYILYVTHLHKISRSAHFSENKIMQYCKREHIHFIKSGSNQK